MLKFPWNPRNPPFPLSLGKSFIRLSSSTGSIPLAFFLIMVERVDCADFAEIFSFFRSCSCSCFVSLFFFPFSTCPSQSVCEHFSQFSDIQYKISSKRNNCFAFLGVGSSFVSIPFFLTKPPLFCINPFWLFLDKSIPLQVDINNC